MTKYKYEFTYEETDLMIAAMMEYNAPVKQAQKFLQIVNSIMDQYAEQTKESKETTEKKDTK